MAIRQRNRVRQRKTLLAVLSIVTLALVYDILLGNHGLRRYLELRSVLETRSAEAYRRIVRNRTLLERLAGLRSDPRVLEEIARSNLGVVGEDEIVFVFRSPRDTSR